MGLKKAVFKCFEDFLLYSFSLLLYLFAFNKLCRCMENKKRRADGQGCEDCPPCYNLVQDAVNAHRRELKELDDVSFS